MKACIACAEKIQPEATLCRFCNTQQNSTVNINSDEAQKPRTQNPKGAKKIALSVMALLLPLVVVAIGVASGWGDSADRTNTESSDSIEASEAEPTETAPPEPEISEFSQLSVLKSAFSYNAELDIAYAHLVLENPDENFAHDYSEAEVAIFDKDGKVITVDEIWIGDISAGGTYALTEMLRGEGVPASMELKLTNAVWHPKGTVIQSLDAEQLFTNASVEYNGYYIEVLADFTAPADLSASEVRVTVLYFNKAGEIVGGDEKSLTVIAGRVHSFELLDGHPTYTPASYQFFVRPLES